MPFTPFLTTSPSPPQSPIHKKTHVSIFRAAFQPSKNHVSSTEKPTLKRKNEIPHTSPLNSPQNSTIDSEDELILSTPISQKTFSLKTTDSDDEILQLPQPKPKRRKIHQPVASKSCPPSTPLSLPTILMTPQKPALTVSPKDFF